MLKLEYLVRNETEWVAVQKYLFAQGYDWNRGTEKGTHHQVYSPASGEFGFTYPAYVHLDRWVANGQVYIYWYSQPTPGFSLVPFVRYLRTQKLSRICHE